MGPVAKLIYTNTHPDTLVVPTEMGKPRDDQLRGSPLDNLVELAGRVCYDSLGTGRSSVDYHRHIQAVGHGSVLEHATVVVEFDLQDLSKKTGEQIFTELFDLCNRPGASIRRVCKDGKTALRITANLRAIVEWGMYSFVWPTQIHAAMHDTARVASPLVMSGYLLQPSGIGGELIQHGRAVLPDVDGEVWLSFYIEGISRGLSHELVRHKYRTAVSQRSTRFVDESESPWCLHPLVEKVLASPVGDADLELLADVSQFTMLSRSMYRRIVDRIQTMLTEKSVDKLSARKQARGAARGVLGNALETKMVFSCSLSELNHIMNMRASDFADAEIRLLANEMAKAVKNDPRTNKLRVIVPNHKAADGIGLVCNNKL